MRAELTLPASLGPVFNGVEKVFLYAESGGAAELTAVMSAADRLSGSGDADGARARHRRNVAEFR